MLTAASVRWRNHCRLKCSWRNFPLNDSSTPFSQASGGPKNPGQVTRILGLTSFVGRVLPYKGSKSPSPTSRGSDEPDERRRRKPHAGQLVGRSATARRWKARVLNELSFQGSHQPIELCYHRSHRVGLREINAGAFEDVIGWSEPPDHSKSR